MKNNNYLSDLVKQFRAISSDSEMIEFLHGILTPQELVELPRRLAIVKKLKAGLPQHQIAKELGVGIATVTRGSKEIQKGRFKNV